MGWTEVRFLIHPLYFYDLISSQSLTLVQDSAEAPSSGALGPSCLSCRQGLGQRRADPRGSAVPAVLLRRGEAPQYGCVCLLFSHARTNEISQSHRGADEAMELVGFSATRATRTEAQTGSSFLLGKGTPMQPRET